MHFYKEFRGLFVIQMGVRRNQQHKAAVDLSLKSPQNDNFSARNLRKQSTDSDIYYLTRALSLTHIMIESPNS
jgi:hypothetical protein